MHHKAYALRVRIIVQRLDIEIRIRGHEIENIVLGIAEPVLPADIPPFHQKLVETVLRGKIDIAAHIRIVGTVASCRLCGSIVGLAEFHGTELAGIGPVALAGNHLPPYAHVFYRSDP